jgi:inositol-phosphate phosphatase / L-galactose 1-phosphate phosphatase
VLQVTAEGELGQALVATEIGTTRDPETVEAIFDRVSAVTRSARSVRCSGSCALNLCRCARCPPVLTVGTIEWS